jgi:predicted nucleic acid-binding protein
LEKKVMLVLDTNVFVAAGFNPRSASAALVRQVRRGELDMVWNDATRREIEYVVRRIPPVRTFAIDDLFRPEHRYTGATHPTKFRRIPDPDDRKFAALAYATGATLISNDEHLLAYQGDEITVKSPSWYGRAKHDR